MNNLFPYDLKEYFDFILKTTFGSGVKTFLYHRIKIASKEESLVAKLNKHPFCVDPKRFESQIKKIKNNNKVIAIDDFLDGNIPKNAAMITFDDGYKDFYTNAFPILKKYKIPATIFLISDFVNTNKAFWWDEILNAVFSTKVDSFDGFKLTSEKDKAKLYCYLTTKFDETSHQDKELYIEKVKKGLGYKRIKGENLSWNEVNKIKQNGITIGSHTEFHSVLTKIPIKKAKEEILNSKIKIESKINQEVKSFTYPHGLYNSKIKKIVKSAGYSCAFTIFPKKNNFNDDLFELGRFPLY